MQHLVLMSQQALIDPNDRRKKLEWRRAYYQKNKEKLREQDRQFRQRHPEKIRAKNKRQYWADPERRRALAKEARLKNPQAIKAAIKAWKCKNKPYVLEYQRKYIKTPRSQAYRRNRYKEDLNHRLTIILRTRFLAAIKSGVKMEKALKLVGCSIEFLKGHLEAKFKEGMTWENHGEWHIDHIKPCVSFDMTSTEQQKACFHFTNLQPLWAAENLKKKDRVPVYA